MNINSNVGRGDEFSSKVLPFRPISTVQPKTKRDLLPVISVGSDERLLGIREQLIVRVIGLRVRSVNPNEALGLARTTDARLWVFCSTVEPCDLVSLAKAVRTYSPQSRLLQLDRDYEISPVETALFDCVIDPLRIEVMLAVINQLAASAAQRN